MATTTLRKRSNIGRVFAVGTAFVLTSTLAACGGGDSTTPTTGATGDETTSEPDSSSDGDAADVSGDIRILVSSASASDAAFQEVVDAFNETYPDANAILTSVPNDSYPTTKSAQLTAGEVDIFVVKSFREMPEYAADATPDDVQLAQAGSLLDLTDEPFMSNYSESVLASQAIDGRQYAIPTGLSFVTGVYYNKSLFEDNGVEVPTTWSELQAAVATFEDADVTAFGIGGKDTWPAGLVMNGVVGSLYPTADAKQAAVDGLWNQSVALDEGTPREVLEKTQWIFEHAQEHFSGAGYDDMPSAFARGEFAMLPDGTWNEPTIASAVGDAFEIGYFPLPASDNAADNLYLNGKVELQLGAYAGTSNEAGTLAFLDFFSQKDVYTKFAATSGFTAAQPDIDQSDFLNSIADYTAQFEPVWESIWVANPLAGDAAVFPFNYPALAPLGPDSVETAAAASADAWVKAF